MVTVTVTIMVTATEVATVTVTDMVMATAMATAMVTATDMVTERSACRNPLASPAHLDFEWCMLDALPHGPEFRFLDSLRSLEPGQSGCGNFLLKGDEAFLRGHFPEQPIFPGVLMIEAVAQLAGVVAQSDPHLPPLPNLRLTAVRLAKIFGTFGPGESVEIHAKITGRLGNLIQAEGKVCADGRDLCRTEITLSGDHSPRG